MKRSGFFIFALSILWIASLQLLAQEEKSAVKVSLTYTQVNDQPPVLKLTTKVKAGKKFTPLAGAEGSVWYKEETKEGLIGQFKTDKQGLAFVTLPSALATRIDSLSPLKFIAAVSATAKWDEEKTETEVTRAKIELTLTEVDSVRKIEAKVLAIKDGKWVEVPATELKFFVKRLFSDFPVGETATTDDAGAASTEYNITIPGDIGGNIIVGAKIDDNETYGTISGVKTMKWGTPTEADNSFYDRTLWAARDKTPYWLLIFPNVIIATVWGFIIYLVYLIIRIRNVGINDSNV